MALKKKIDIYGYQPEYIIIDTVDFSKVLNNTKFRTLYYKNEEERRENLEAYIFRKDYCLPGCKSIIECYEYLKTLPEFDGSEDVIEEESEQEVESVLIEEQETAEENN